MKLWKKVRQISHGWNGILIAWDKEVQFPYQVGLVALALSLALLLRVGMSEFLILLVALTLALVAELFNTTVEVLCDKIEPSHDPHIGKIKDLGAACVIVAGIPSIVVTIWILLPRLLDLW